MLLPPLQILMDHKDLSLFLGSLYVFLGEVSVEVLCPFFNWVVCLPGVELCEFFLYFGDQALVWGIIGKYVFTYCWFSFHFNAVFFSPAEAFYFHEVHLFILSFMSITFKVFNNHMWLVATILDNATIWSAVFVF